MHTYHIHTHTHTCTHTDLGSDLYFSAQEIGGNGDLGLYYNVSLFFERRMAADDQVRKRERARARERERERSFVDNQEVTEGR
jgi:hypothetical protein